MNSINAKVLTFGNQVAAFNTGMMTAMVTNASNVNSSCLVSAGNSSTFIIQLFNFAAYTGGQFNGGTALTNL